MDELAEKSFSKSKKKFFPSKKKKIKKKSTRELFIAAEGILKWRRKKIFNLRQIYKIYKNCLSEQNKKNEREENEESLNNFFKRVEESASGIWQWQLIDNKTWQLGKGSEHETRVNKWREKRREIPISKGKRFVSLWAIKNLSLTANLKLTQRKEFSLWYQNWGNNFLCLKSAFEVPSISFLIEGRNEQQQKI